MSAEADFGLSDWVGQASGTEMSWDISWPGVLDDSRFAAVSFQTDLTIAPQLVRVSEWFATDRNGNQHVGELIRTPQGPGPGNGFRFAVVVIPNH
jgi:hypothetical protein